MFTSLAVITTLLLIEAIRFHFIRQKADISTVEKEDNYVF